MKKIDKLAWLCIKDKRLLLARSKGKSLYYIPGGKREAGESDQDALIREINEELTIKLIPASIKYAGAFEAQADGKHEEVMVNIICYFADYIGEIQANAEIEKISWLNYQDKHKCSLAARIVIDWLKSEEMIE